MDAAPATNGSRAVDDVRAGDLCRALRERAAADASWRGASRVDRRARDRRTGRRDRSVDHRRTSVRRAADRGGCWIDGARRARSLGGAAHRRVDRGDAGGRRRDSDRVRTEASDLNAHVNRVRCAIDKLHTIDLGRSIRVDPDPRRASRGVLAGDARRRHSPAGVGRCGRAVARSSRHGGARSAGERRHVSGLHDSRVDAVRRERSGCHSLFRRRLRGPDRAAMGDGRRRVRADVVADRRREADCRAAARAHQCFPRSGRGTRFARFSSDGGAQ